MIPLCLVTGLNRQFHLDQIITVIEPRSFLRLIHTLPNVIAQVEAADVVLLNKCDLYEEEILLQAESAAKGIRENVACVRTVQAATGLACIVAGNASATVQEWLASL